MRNAANKKIQEMLRIIENLKESDASGPPRREHNSVRPTQAEVVARFVPPKAANSHQRRTPREKPEAAGQGSNETREGMPPKPKRPSKFFNKLHERKTAFKAAEDWLGLFLEREELEAWIGSPEKKEWHIRKIIKDPINDGARRNAITEKIEINTSLHIEDIVINDYFMTCNNGIIAWIQLETDIVQRIFRETSKIPSKTFKAVPFIPDIARTRKKAVDSILLGYKKSVDDNLRYIIKNDTDDLKILLKRFNDYDYLPYREIQIKSLGKLPDFETVTQEDRVSEHLALRVEDPDAFQVQREQRKRKQRSSPRKLTKDQIHANITRFLDGFEVEDSEDESETDTENEEPRMVEIPASEGPQVEADSDELVTHQ